jgi:predicted Zn finger-like uncharacterized protein
MIRFECPGCQARYTVPDDKAGKVTRCSRCRAKFYVPAAPASPDPPKAAVAPSSTPMLPTPPTIPPPPAAELAPYAELAEDDDVEIAPCPKCDARLMVAERDVGSDVECPYCLAIYRAARPRLDPPRRRPVVDESEGLGRTDCRDDGDDEPEDRDDAPRKPRGRRKKRKRSGGGLLTAVAVVHFLAAFLHLTCSGCSFFLWGQMRKVASDDVRIGRPAPQFDDPELRAKMEESRQKTDQAMRDSIGTMTKAIFIFGLVCIVTGGVMATAGVGCIARRGYGRILSYLCAAVTVCFIVSSIVLDLMFGPRHDMGAIITRAVVGLITWGSYAAFVTYGVTKDADAFE